ncbi:MAG: hypothetical protein AAF466_13100, partial [Bacteroidota bacterium]
MIALTYKSKQYGLLALKVLILTLTFGYIYVKITGEGGITPGQYLESIRFQDWPFLGIFLSLAALNWLLEICKWRSLASVVQPVSFREAVRQSLASLTVSLATPGRIGEYGAKAVFLPSNLRKKVLLLIL